MSTRCVYIFSIVALLLTTPFFTSTLLLFGFPAWAFYSLLAIVAYSIIIAIFLQIHWHTEIKEDD